jgi:hypothetical protein
MLHGDDSPAGGAPSTGHIPGPTIVALLALRREAIFRDEFAGAHTGEKPAENALCGLPVRKISKTNKSQKLLKNTRYQVTIRSTVSIYLYLLHPNLLCKEL